MQKVKNKHLTDAKYGKKLEENRKGHSYQNYNYNSAVMIKMCLEQFFMIITLILEKEERKNDQADDTR